MSEYKVVIHFLSFNFGSPVCRDKETPEVETTVEIARDWPPFQHISNWDDGGVRVGNCRYMPTLALYSDWVEYEKWKTGVILGDKIEGLLNS